MDHAGEGPGDRLPRVSIPDEVRRLCRTLECAQVFASCVRFARWVCLHASRWIDVGGSKPHLPHSCAAPRSTNPGWLRPIQAEASYSMRNRSSWHPLTPT